MSEDLRRLRLAGEADLVEPLRHNLSSPIRFLSAIAENIGRAVQGTGTGCVPAPTGPLTLDLDRHRRTRP